MLDLLSKQPLLIPQSTQQVGQKNPTALVVGVCQLQFLSPTFGFIAFSLVLGKALNGAGDTFSPMIITLAAQVGVGLGLVILFSHFYGLKGVWIGIALSNVVQGIAMWIWYRTGRWKTKKIIKNGSRNTIGKVA